MEDEHEIAAIPHFWTRQYAFYLNEHRHPLNRLTHLFGIPILVLTLAYGLYRKNWKIVAGGQAIGWAIQLLGHRIEGNKPALLKNPSAFLMGPLMVTIESLELLGFSFAFAEEARGVVHGVPAAPPAEPSVQAAAK